MSKPQYEVIVGNLGTVYQGSSKVIAEQEFEDYVKLSKEGYGRAGHEEVTLTIDGEPAKEHYPARVCASCPAGDVYLLGGKVSLDCILANHRSVTTDASGYEKPDWCPEETMRPAEYTGDTQLDTYMRCIQRLAAKYTEQLFEDLQEHEEEILKSLEFPANSPTTPRQTVAKVHWKSTRIALVRGMLAYTAQHTLESSDD